MSMEEGNHSTRPKERKKKKSEGKNPFARYTKRVLTKGSPEEADAWLLAYPLFSSSSPTRELFGLWEKRCSSTRTFSFSWLSYKTDN
jgi:hypothetical protein